jgi:hypothetical protein
MLELHHEHAFALGGPATAKNLTLRCRAHNALAAEQDFGRDFVLAKAGARGDDPRWRGDDPRWRGNGERENCELGPGARGNPESAEPDGPDEPDG